MKSEGRRGKINKAESDSVLVLCVIPSEEGERGSFVLPTFYAKSRQKRWRELINVVCDFLVNGA